MKPAVISLRADSTVGAEGRKGEERSASHNASLSLYFDLIECTQRCEIYSIARQIVLSYRKPKSFGSQ